ncbi:S9 family peptidase [Inhella crocodyli]|uniref:S9 family peptidase n=1 Tax=Inhella crocodyli TaxID=2499851 RepID=A0A3S2V5C0_9BURK|nr:alpha/beta fold hydrolase [Inhella crocodyli]RVT88821.1 S9 family peptidase [Inhella crocodyli]
MTRSLLLALGLSLATGLATPAAAQTLTLERLTADPPLAGRLPRQAEISPGGRWVSLLQPSQADSEQLELWARPTAGGAPRRLVAAADLLGGAAQVLSEAEKMALERRRISERGITQYQWCGKADDRLLFPLSGDLYQVRLTDAGPVAQRLTHSPDQPKQDPRCSADGRRVAYAMGGHLWVQALDGDQPARALTPDGGATLTPTVSWGLPEFIAAEEFDRQRGFWWSPDGTQLLALRVDEARVGLKTRAQIFADRTTLTEQRYPAAGEANAEVTAWRIDVATGQRQALPLPKDAEYLVRAGWFRDGTPWLQWMPRDQTRLTLTEFTANGPRELLTDTDPAWVEAHSDLMELPGVLRSGRPALLWSSEASGRRQLQLVDRVTGARTALTDLPEPVAHAVCTDGQRVVLAAALDRGRGRDLFVLNAAEAQPTIQPTVQPLPGSAPRQWRDAQADLGCTQLLETRSAFGEPPRLSLRPVSGEGATPLPGDAPDPLLRQILRAPQALDLTAADGRTPLNAFYFAPQGAVKGRHPVLVLAYGGPGAATVTWAWSRDSAWVAHWTQRGYGVLALDTRGMAHRDRAFTRAHHRAFGLVEVADLFAAVRALPKLQPRVDPQRIGFFGWSFGGFLAARALLDADTPFAAAVGVAPVTDWTLYDTAYTERYLGLPEGGKAAPYAQAHLPSRAKLLKQPLMLVHGTADDNVLFEHSLRLVEALQQEGKVFDTLIYPGKAHGIAGRQARLHLYRSVQAFFDRHLKPGSAR